MTKAALKSHKKIHQSADAAYSDEEEMDLVDQYDQDDDITIITDLNQWFQPVFEEN